MLRFLFNAWDFLRRGLAPARTHHTQHSSPSGAPLSPQNPRCPGAARREVLVVVMRLLLVAFINLVSIPSYQAFVPRESLAKASTFWMLTGAESLLITALGLQVGLCGRTSLRCSVYLGLLITALGLRVGQLLSRFAAVVVPVLGLLIAALGLQVGLMWVDAWLRAQACVRVAVRSLALLSSNAVLRMQAAASQAHQSFTSGLLPLQPACGGACSPDLRLGRLASC